jgi:hypothetical protein
VEVGGGGAKKRKIMKVKEGRGLLGRGKGEEE